MHRRWQLDPTSILLPTSWCAYLVPTMFPTRLWEDTPWSYVVAHEEHMTLISLLVAPWINLFRLSKLRIGTYSTYLNYNPVQFLTISRVWRPLGPTSGVLRLFVKVGGENSGVPELKVMVDVILRGECHLPSDSVDTN